MQKQFVHVKAGAKAETNNAVLIAYMDVDRL
jgi:hypothetical protein